MKLDFNEWMANIKNIYYADNEQMLNAFEKANGLSVPYEFVDRRDGDIAECWASTQYTESVLGWKARYDISKMCKDAWRWQSKNPKGYGI